MTSSRRPNMQRVEDARSASERRAPDRVRPTGGAVPGAAAVHLHAVGFAVAVALLGASGCRPRSAHEKERAAAARTKPPVPACESFDRAAAACLAGGGGGLAPRERSQLETQRAQFRQIVAAASSEAARSALSRSCAVSERTLSGKCAPLAGRR